MTLTVRLLRSLLETLKDNATVEILIPTDTKGEQHIFAHADHIKIVNDECGKWDDLNVWIYLRELEVDIATKSRLKNSGGTK